MEDSKKIQKRNEQRVKNYNQNQIPTEVKNNKEVALGMMVLFLVLLFMSAFI